LKKIKIMHCIYSQNQILYTRYITPKRVINRKVMRRK